MEQNYKEILRYLGYGNHEADNQVITLIDEVSKELLEVAEPKSIYRCLDITENTESLVDLSFFRVESRNLARNLQGCTKILLFAATLGAKVDQLIRKYNKIQVSKAVVLQAASTELIESYCDSVQAGIKEEYEPLGYYLRPRFSPGYGDFQLEHQKNLISILECSKKIGLTLTDSLIMMPSKSVTAVIGLGRSNVGCIPEGCESCRKKNCAYRRG